MKLNIPDEYFQLDGPAHRTSRADTLIAEFMAFGTYATERERTMEVYQKSLQQGSKATLENATKEETQENRDALVQESERMLTEDPDRFQEIGPALPDALATVEDEARDPLTPLRVKVREMSHPDLPDRIIDRQTEYLWYDLVRESSNDQSWFKTARDMVAYFFYPNESVIANKFAGKGGLSEYFYAAENVETVANRFWALDKNDRMAAFVGLLDEVKEVTDNSIKANNLINAIVKPEVTADLRSHYMWDQLGAIGAAADVLSLGALGATKLNRIAMISKALKNDRLAVEAATAAADSEAVSGALGTDRVSASVALLPNRIAPEIVDGMPTDLQRSVAEVMTTNRLMVEGLRKVVMEEGLDTLVDASQAEARMMRELPDNFDGFISADIVSSDARGVTFRVRTFAEDSSRANQELNALTSADAMGSDNYRIVSRTDNGFELEFYVPGETEARRIPYQYDDVAIVTKPYILDDIKDGFKVDGYSPTNTMLSSLTSPQMKFGDDMDTLGNPFTRILFQSAQYRNTLNSRFRQLYALTNKKGRERVAKALHEGNLSGESFDVPTLRNRFDMNDKDVTQYFGMRDMMDIAWGYKNQELRNTFIAQGLRQYEDMIGGRHFVKEYSTFQSASAAIRDSRYSSAYVMDMGEAPRPVTLRSGTGGDISPQVEQLIEDGYVMVRKGNAGEAFQVSDDVHSGYLFVKADEVGEIGPNVLDYREGYIPLFYGPDANYFGREAVFGTVDGARVQVGGRTPVYFTNKADAVDWARAKNYDAMMAKHGDEVRALKALDDPNESLPFSFKYDREMNASELDHVATMGMGGQYTGARATHRLRKGVDMGDPDYVDVFTSMQRYMDNIANNLPMSVFRVGIEDKWLKHAKATGSLPQEYRGGFREAVGLIENNTNIPAGVRKMLIDSHEHISYNTRVPTLGEREVNGYVRQFAEKLESVSLPGMGREGMVTKALHRLDHTNPIDALRSSTFHVLLGFYNPAQYLVQGMGSTVAMSADPTIFPRAYPLASTFHLLDNITNPQALEGAIKKLKHIDPNLQDKYNAWRKMGFYEDIVQSRADYISMSRSHYVGGDMIDRLFNASAKELDRGLFFYKSGEMWNRRYSVAAAMERHLADGGVLKTDADIKRVMDKANVFMLNMHRSMKADWQKGILSIPTQFLQVHTKYLESLFGKQLTRAEKLKLAGGQVALFGSLGIPMGNYAAGHILAGMGFQQGEINEGVLEAANGGISNLLTGYFLGVENIVAQRGAIPFGIGDTLERLFDDNASWGEVLLGATGGMLDRSAQAASAIHNITKAGGFDVSSYDERDVLAAANEVARITSTWRNGNAAYELRNNKVLRDRKGNKLIASDDVNFQSMVAKAMGFEFTELQNLYTNERAERDVNQAVRDKTDAFSTTFFKIFSEDGVSDRDKAKFEIMVASFIDGEPPEVQRRILDGFKRRIMEPETRIDRANRAYLERIMNEMNTALDHLSSSQNVLRENN